MSDEPRSLLESVNLALQRAMKDNWQVLVIGEDVAVNGGVFRATTNLFDEFGGDRVIDTPLAETVIAGLSVGLASQGFRPVAEIQFMGFIYPCIDQLVNHASRLRSRTRGRLSCPLVLRVPFGGGIGAPEHHSESVEAMLAHIPGLRVVIPSSPHRAYGLLLAAIDDPDPVVFLEPKRLYRASTQAFADDGERYPLDRCEVLRMGADITIVTWGAMVQDVLAAADSLAEEGIEAEIIDAVTLKPLDTATILESVSRTGRLIIVHEAAMTAGFGAEVAASVACDGLFDLKAPVVRVAGYDTVMPLASLEQWYMPDAARVIDAARRTMAYA
jgi:pyruvate dehydrogenase E1 component beta subunit